jgi:hypothetical protein
LRAGCGKIPLTHDGAIALSQGSVAASKTAIEKNATIPKVILRFNYRLKIL